MNANNRLNHRKSSAPHQLLGSTFVCDEVLRIIRDAHQIKNDRILRLPVVKTTVGKAGPTVWKDIKEGTFPPAISIGPRAVGWKESEISAWIQVREFVSRSGRFVDMKAFISLLVAKPRA